MRNKAAGICAGLVLLVTPILAHHPFEAEFDWKKPITLSGTVTKFEWTNPHSYIYIDAKDTSGKMANWKIEMGGPGSLSRLGWIQNGVKVGDKVTVDAWQAKTSNALASAKSVRFSDGRELDAGSSFVDSQDQAGAQRATVGSKTPKSAGTAGRK